MEFSAQTLQECCAVLNEFALPRAIVDFERHSFVAWNPRFLEEAGCSESDIRSIKPEEMLALGDSWLLLREDTSGQKVEFVPCAARRPFGTGSASGYVVRSQGKIGYVMLDVFDSPSRQFESGRIVGMEEERDRITKAYNDEVSSSMIAALFLVEEAKTELEEARLPQAETVSKVSQLLTETTEKIANALGSTEASSG